MAQKMQPGKENFLRQSLILCDAMPSKTDVPLRVLLDRSVVVRTDTTDSVIKIEKVDWGGSALELPISGYRRKLPLGPTEEWMQEQINCLPTLMRLAREGDIQLYTHDELGFEYFRGSTGTRGVKGDLMSGIRVIDVPTPIDRSKFRSASIQEYATRDALERFCKFLIEITPQHIQSVPQVFEQLSEFEQKNLENLDRFQEICSSLTPNHYPDAFHLWTAETNGLDYFLTNDGKFINAVYQSSRARLVVEPISPAMLVDILGIEKLDPMPIGDKEFYNWFD